MRIAVLTSGGVDSSLALHELKTAGHEITAFYLKIWLEDELAYLGSCPWEEDLSYVRQLCEQLQVPLEVVNFQEAYWSRVVQYALQEIKAGRTPNPDIMCNKMVKFGAFIEYLTNQPGGNTFDAIATGHYASTITSPSGVSLKMAPDPIKDQTYFLSQLSQDQLQKILFPIGQWNKAEVRQRAQEANLPTKDRKDSQGICFLGNIKFSEFLRHHFGDMPGDLVEVETGKKMGTHQGFYYYTLGQRQGIGLSGGPWYVVKKDTKNNIVYISRSYYAADKERNEFYVGDCSWISGKAPEVNDAVSPAAKAPGDTAPAQSSGLPSPKNSLRLAVKLRHGPAMHNATLIPEGDGRYLVKLDSNDQGIAPGQFAAFYDGDICLGSGVILD